MTVLVLSIVLSPCAHAGKDGWRNLKASCGGWIVPEGFEIFPIESYKWEIDTEENIKDLEFFANHTCRSYYNHSNGAKKINESESDELRVVTLEEFVSEQNRIYGDSLELNQEGRNRISFLKVSFADYQTAFQAAGENAGSFPCPSVFLERASFVERRLLTLRKKISQVMKTCPALAELDAALEKNSAKIEGNATFQESGFIKTNSTITKEPEKK